MAEAVELQTAGNMWKVLVKPGDQVKQGDVLVHHGSDEDGSPARGAV